MVKVFSFGDFNNLIAGFIVYDHIGNAIFGSNTNVHEYGNIKFEKEREYIINFKFTMPYIKNGNFTISPAIAEGIQNDHIQHHWIHNVLTFRIHSLREEATMGWLILNKDIEIRIDNE